MQYKVYASPKAAYTFSKKVQKRGSGWRNWNKTKFAFRVRTMSDGTAVVEVPDDSRLTAREKATLLPTRPPQLIELEQSLNV